MTGVPATHYTAVQMIAATCKHAEFSCLPVNLCCLLQASQSATSTLLKAVSVVLAVNVLKFAARAHNADDWQIGHRPHQLQASASTNLDASAKPLRY